MVEILFIKKTRKILYNGIEYRLDGYLFFIYDQKKNIKYLIITNLQYAYDNTIYYKKLFDELDCSVRDINEMKDLKLLPFIDKNIVRENFYDIMSINFSKKNFFYYITGGCISDLKIEINQIMFGMKELYQFINYYFSKFGYDKNLN